MPIKEATCLLCVLTPLVLGEKNDNQALFLLFDNLKLQKSSSGPKMLSVEHLAAREKAFPSEVGGGDQKQSKKGHGGLYSHIVPDESTASSNLLLS